MPQIAVATIANYVYTAIVGAGYSKFWAAVAAAVVAKVASNAFGLNKKLGLPDFADSAEGRTRVSRTSTANRYIIYGETVMSGPLVFAAATGQDNKYLHLVIPLAGHECQAINSVFLGEDEIRNDQIDGTTNLVVDGKYFLDKKTCNGEVTNSTSFVFSNITGEVAVSVGDDFYVDGFSNAANNGIFTVTSATRSGGQLFIGVSGGLVVEGADPDGPVAGITIGICTVRIKRHLGATTQAADSDLVSEVSDWTADHRLREIAYVYVRLRYSAKLFPAGVPNIKAVVQGKKIYDPRSTTTYYTDNWALCVRDYLLASNGVGADSTEVNDTSFIAAANIADESVALPDYTTGTVNATNGSDIIVGVGTGWKGRIYSGDSITVTGQGTFTVDEVHNNLRIKLTANYTGATVSGNAYTITRTRNRYTCNGAIDTGVKPADNLPQLTTAGAGAVIYSQGEYTIFAGAYTSSVANLTESHLRGPIKVRPNFSRKELYNAVRGTYLGAERFWQPTDFPPVVNATYATEDGGETIYNDIELPFTNEPNAAQRIAKIHLEKSRQGITVEFPANMSALELRPFDTVQLTIDKFGWTNKEFRVLEWRLAGAGVDLILQEEASASYNWSSGDATVVDPAPDTDLPDVTQVTAPTGLTLNSGEAYLLLGDDGSIVSRINCTWTRPENPYVERYDIEAKKSSETDYTLFFAVDRADTTEAYVSPVADGVDYDVRIRAVNTLGYRSDYTEVTDHTVIGKTTPPDDVTGFVASQNGGVAIFKWNQVANVDLSGYEIRYMGNGTPNWEDATPLTKVTKGTNITSADLPPGTWTVYIKARDTSGNYSTNAASHALTFVRSDQIIIQEEQAPDWSGAKTNFVKHHTGKLIPSDQNGPGFYTAYEAFESFVPTPYATCQYDAPELDGGFDDSVGVWGTIESALGPLETGIADPHLYIDYKTDAGAYDGYELWSIGKVLARYVKHRIQLDTSEGKAVITGFLPTLDQAERTETFNNQAIAASGTAIVFETEFHNNPLVTVTVVGSSALIGTVTSLTTTGCTVHIFNTVPTDVGGTANITVTGV